MSKQSEAVKRWRHHCKTRIVDAMGGSCCICSYNRCQSALALHHLDPSKKDISLGSIRANPKNWITIVKELRKCILVCHVCHSEIHDNIIEVPIDAPKFNEDFVCYKKIKDFNNLLTPCPICDKLKPSHLINCSLECSGKSKRKIDWDKIDLQEELKTKSIVMLAEQLGCSDAAIHKRLKKDRMIYQDDNFSTEYYNGNKFWYLNDELHREDGPAIEFADGEKYWYINGNRHRIDGPAVEYADGTKKWFLNNKEIHCKCNEEFLRLVKLKAFL